MILVQFLKPNCFLPCFRSKFCYNRHNDASFVLNFLFSFTGEFARNLPDYQKIEIMMFIMGKFPQFPPEEFGSVFNFFSPFNIRRASLTVLNKHIYNSRYSV